MKRLLLSLAVLICSTYCFGETLPDVVVEKTLALGETLNISPTSDMREQYGSKLVTVYGDCLSWWVNGSKFDQEVFTVETKKISGQSGIYPYSYYEYKLTAKQGGDHQFKTRLCYRWKESSTNYVIQDIYITYKIHVPYVYKIELPNSLGINVGESNKLNAIVTDSDASYRLTWSSDNENVATVSSDGTVTGVRDGTATIKCTANNGVFATCVVTVSSIKVTNIVLPSTSITLNKGESYYLSPTILPANATNKQIIWSTSNDAIVTIPSNSPQPSSVSIGIITPDIQSFYNKIEAVGEGTATITGTAADGSGVTVQCKVTVQNIPVTKITLSSSSVSIVQGSTYQLKPTIVPENASNQEVSWSSSNTAVAKVNSSGVVTAVKEGNATITCTAKDGSGVKATCQVTVKPILVSSITLSQSSGTIGDTNMLQLTATVKPTNANNKNVTWTSSNTSVATVDSNGLVTAKGKGTATITCTAKDGSGVKATCEVTVNAIYVKSLSIDRENCTLEEGEVSQLNAVVEPSNTTYYSLTWQSNNTSVATVDNSGKVTAVNAGTATITCKLNMTESSFFADPYEKTATCVVTVTKKKEIPVTSITLSSTNVSINIGSTYQLTSKVAPDNATNKAVSWSSGNTSIATVNSSGLITAVGQGTATITCTAKDGSGVKATCQVKVTPILISSITLNQSSCTIEETNTLQLVAVIAPSNSSNTNLTWTSSNTSVATVDSKGLVTAKGEGVATITCTSKDGRGVKATCVIVVTKKVNPENSESYAVYQDGVLTFYNDDKKGMREGTVYELNNGTPGWYNEHRTDITKAVFDDSFAGARPTSTYRWFALGSNETSNLTEIQGIQNLNTSNVTNMFAMFYGCSSLTSLDLSHFDTSNVTDMSSMFSGCSGLTSLDLSHFDTGNVKSMNSMFWICSSLKNLDVSHFDTGNVTSMFGMFLACRSLTSLDVSHFDTGNVTNMSSMFNGCSGLTSLDVSHFDTGNVTRMSQMFQVCSGLTSLDLSHFDTSNVTNMEDMFNGCSGLTSLDLSNFDTSNVTNMNNMFENCTSLTSITLPNSMTRIGEFAFKGCSNLPSITLPNGLTAIGTNAFRDCSRLTSVTVGNPSPVTIDSNTFTNRSNAVLYVPCGSKAAYQNANYWKEFKEIVEEVNPENCEPYAVYQDGVLTFYYDDKKGTREETVYGLNEGYNTPGWYTDHRTDITKAVFDDSFAGARPTSTYQWFAVRYNETSNLTEIQGIQNLNTSKATSMNSMFYRCSSLMSLDVSHFDTSNVTNMGSMFYGCSGLMSLDVSHFDTGNVTYMDCMFYRCSSLTSLDLSHFNTKNVKDMYSMFSACSNLTSLDLSNFDTSNVTRMVRMFHGCSSLTSLDLSHFDTGNVTYMYSMFSGCSSLRSLDVSNFDTGNVTDMSSMFSGCSSLTSLDVSHFDTGKVTSMNHFFSGCSGLTSLDVSHFDTGKVTDMYAMFNDCSGLTSLDVSHFDTSNVTSMDFMFYRCSGLTSLDVSHFYTSNVIGMFAMFYGCSNLTSLDLSHFDTGNVTTMFNMFSGCSSLTSLDVNHFDTSNVTSMGSMFSGCSSLTSLDVSHFDTGNVTDMRWMFNGCSNLSIIYCNDTWTCSSSTNMFSNCKSLPGFNSANSNVDYAKPIELGGYFTRVENNPNGIIDFADAEVKRICVENWDTNGDGELSYGEAAAVEDIDLAFYNSDIVSFDEFQYFKGLKKVSGYYTTKAEDGDYYIGHRRGFAQCKNLENITLPQTIEIIEDYAFNGDAKLKAIKLPDSLISIGCYAFDYCSSLQDVSIPNGLKKIERFAFLGCQEFTSLYIPSSVTFIGYAVTATYSDKLRSIIVSEDNPNYDSRDNCNAIIATSSNKLIAGCETSIIPQTVTSIGNRAFLGRYGFKSIEIPGNIKTIEEYAYAACKNVETIILHKGIVSIADYVFNSINSLKEVYSYSHEPISIQKSTFGGKESNVTLYVPYGCKAAYEAADYWKEFKEIIEMDGENSLYADDVTVRPGVQKTITLQLDNENTFVAGEFRLQLPAGMRIETDEDGDPVANLVSGRSNKHTLMVTDEGNGLYHFMFYSGQNRAILGNSGDFISLSVIADEGVDDGSYTAKLKNVFFSTEDEKRIDLPDVDFNIVVLDYTPGDVNGDGLLNVMDVVKLVNYIMGRNPSDFVFAAADMDENGKINVMDLVNVVEVIMAAPQQAPVMGMATSSNLELGRMDKNTVSLSVPDANRHIAAQFTVTLSGNAVLKDVLSDDAHQSEVTRMSDGRYKVMVYSGRNDLFRSDCPISLQLSGNSDVKIDDVVFVDADEEAVAYEPVMTNTTGILSVGTEFSQPTDIYTVSGKLVKKGATSTRGLASGVYIVNNEKVVIKGQ